MKRALRNSEGAAGVPPASTDAALLPGLRSDEVEQLLAAVAQSVEQRDNRSAGHCERLALNVLAMGAALSLDRASLLVLYRAGFLHDVGKIGIPDSILFKPGALTAQEWEVMRSHPLRGEDICRPVQAFAPVLPVIRHHHERWDGTGYPDGLRGEEIPLLARVLQIADIYDALTNPRPYKPAYPPQEAIRIIREETERGWRDPDVVRVFLNLHDNVISKMWEYARRDDSDLRALRSALLNGDENLREPISTADLRQAAAAWTQKKSPIPAFLD